MIQFKSKYDTYYDGAYQTTGNGACGISGRRSGLHVNFYEANAAVDYIQSIPYNQLIEVPMFVSNNALCDVYNNIDIEIVAACEYPGPGSYVYQYGVVDDGKGNKKISYDPAHVLHASSSSKTFSVSWLPAAGTAQTTTGKITQTISDPVTMDMLNKLAQSMADMSHENKTTKSIMWALISLMVLMIVSYIFIKFNSAIVTKCLKMNTTSSDSIEENQVIYDTNPMTDHKKSFKRDTSNSFSVIVDENSSFYDTQVPNYDNMYKKDGEMETYVINPGKCANSQI